MNPNNQIFPSDFGPLIININDQGVGACIAQMGYFEKEQINFLLNLIKELLLIKDKLGIYDVGANIGTHTIPIAKEFGNKVFIRCFEAQRQIFYLLCGNVAINNLNNVFCHNVAVGKKTKFLPSKYKRTIEVSLPNYDLEQNFGGLELLPIKNSDNQHIVKTHSEKVELINLDIYIDEEIDFIKMDIEGMEEEALNGALKLIKKNKPICFVEIFKSDEKKIFIFFKNLGYKGYRTKQDLLAVPQKINITIPSSFVSCF
jgi:FkbM family methyltransferase